MVSAGRVKLLVRNVSRLPVLASRIGDAAKLVWVRRGRLERGKNHRLIRVHARASVYRARGAAFEQDVAFARVTKKAEPSVNW